MAELLTHLVLAYAGLTVLGWRLDWLSRRWVVVGVGGAAIPDLAKIGVVIDGHLIEAALGIEFSYTALSTLGGVILVAGLVTLAFDREQWRRVYGLVVAGGLCSLVVDGMRVYADGRATAWLYPLTTWRPPTPNLYVSSDPRVLLVALGVAVVVFVVDSRQERS